MGIRPLALALVVMAVAMGACSADIQRTPDLVVGIPATTTTTPLPRPTITRPPDPPVVDPPTTAADPGTAASGGGGNFTTGGTPVGRDPDGHAYPAAVPFVDSVPVPAGLVFVLVVGSDARPDEDPRAARGDSLHLLCINPATQTGTMIGIPRDSWVEIPGHGMGKINSVLSLGGPDLMAETVRQVTGLPVDYYIITGFQGFQDIIDDLGGLDIPVDAPANDDDSGVHFAQPGYYHMTGGEALAYARNRHDTLRGDFTRSENQGKIILAALGRLRAETSDMDGVRVWLRILIRHTILEDPIDKLEPLAALARHIDPHSIQNVVADGEIGWAGDQSVVYLNDAAAQLFIDVRDDAVVGDAVPAAPDPNSTGPGEPASDTTAPPTEPPPATAPGDTTPPTTTGPPSTTEPGPTTTSLGPPPTTSPPTTTEPPVTIPVHV